MKPVSSLNNWNENKNRTLKKREHYSNGFQGIQRLIMCYYCEAKTDLNSDLYCGEHKLDEQTLTKHLQKVLYYFS